MSDSQVEIVQRLLLHAGMPRHSQHCDDMSEFLWDLGQTGFTALDTRRLSSLILDILDLIQRLAAITSIERRNLSLSDRMLAETTVSAVNEITKTILAHSIEARIKNANKEIEHALVDSAFAITVAWSEFLVADVDDLCGQVRIEFLCRGIPDRFGWNESG